MAGGSVELVLFDLGGVLFESGGVGQMREFAGISSDEELWARWLGCRWVQAFESGACTPDAFAEGIVADWGLALSPADFLAEFATWPQGPFPGAEELVARVRAQLPVAFLSNMNRSQWEAHYATTALTKTFDHGFLSYELGFVKPDPQVFAAVIERLAMAPGRVLFLDDNVVNVDAGTAAGFVSRHVRGLDEARRALAEAGIETGAGPG